MSTEPICIRRTAAIEEADIIVAWLAERNIEATITDRSNPGSLAFGITDGEGIKIFVADKETAERANALLIEHDRERTAEAHPEDANRTVEVTCEECGQRCTFALDLRGTVQECPECGAYVDVPRCVG